MDNGELGETKSQFIVYASTFSLTQSTFMCDY